MIERLLLALFFVLLGVGACWLFRRWHMRWLSQVTAVTGAPALLYFGSEACASCPTQARYLEQLAQQWPAQVNIRTIDAMAEPETAAQYGVFTLPTTVVVDAAGVVRAVNYGLTHTHKLAQQLQALQYMEKMRDEYQSVD